MTKRRATEPVRLADPKATPREGQRLAGSARGERVLLVVLIFIFAVIGFIPGWRHLNSDFSNYYVVAHLYREGYPLERVYEWIWLQRHADHLGIGRRLVSYIPLTLPSALAVLPLSSLPPLQAKRCWLLLNLAFLGLTLVILARSTNLGARRVGLLMFMALIPLSSNFVYGQMHVLVLLLVTIAAWMYFEGWSFSSGLALAVGAALKIYPGLFLIFFLIKKQWRAAAGLVIGMGAVTLVSIRLFGMDACRVYLREVLPFAMRAQSIDPYDVAWGSPNALLARLLIYEPELNPFPVVHLPWLYAFLYALILASIFATFLWAIGWSRIKDQGRAKLEWASYLVLLLLVSSQPAPYHFVALILPVVLIADFLAERGQWIQAAKLTGLYVLVCGSYKWLCADPTGWKIALCFPRLLFMLLLSGLIWQVLISSSEEPKYLQSRSSLFSACVFVALFASGFVGSLQHFHGQFDNYESRVVTVAGSGLALDPVVRQGEVFFSALVPRFIPSIPDTYAVHELSAGSLTSFAFDGDWVHPSVGKDPHTVWAEMVTTSASQIVRFSSLGPINSPSNFTVEAENAEEPVVSSDGELLAFIREVRGRNSLWVQQVSPVRPEAGTRGEHQIADSEYDVREAAFFPDHRIVFSSRQGGRFRLYEVDPVSALIKEMTVPTCSARYPAISPDGGWLAFSCEERGTWQIHVMNLRTTEQASLTNADCNSISPVWTPDSKNLIYATDCGRGLGLTALARLNVVR